MKKILLSTLGLLLVPCITIYALETTGTITTGASGLDLILPCTPDSVVNGLVNPDTCVITCNAAYKLNGINCDYIVPSGGSSGGGSSSSGKSTSNNTEVNANIEKITETVETATNELGTLNFENKVLTGDTSTVNITGDKGSIILKQQTNSDLSLTIPGGVVATGNSNWNGQIKAPVIIRETKEGIVIEMGSKTSPISFNKPVSLDIKTSIADGTKIEIFSSQDGKNFTSLGFGVVKDGKITIITNHFTYFAVKIVSDDTVINTSDNTLIIPTELIFSDIADSFAKTYIQDLVTKGIIKGYSDNTFRPQNPITRAEFLSVTMKSLNIDSSGSISTDFTDIPAEGQWMIPYIAKAKELGIINGQTIDSKLVFRPNSPISRAEAISILLKTAKIETDESADKNDFTDIPAEGEWMVPYLAKAKELSIMNGQLVNDVLLFRPNDNISREEAVKIITKTSLIK